MDKINFSEFDDAINKIDEYDEETTESIYMLNELICRLKNTNISVENKSINLEKKVIDKNKLEENILGLPIDCKKISDYKNISCIYLICLGYVSELRNIYNIDTSYPDDSILCKYGLSKNLERRLREHDKDFGNKLNKTLFLKFFVTISENKLYYAENILEDIFIRLGVKYDRIPKKTELVIIPKKEIDSIKEEYDKIKIYLLKYDCIRI